MDKEKLKRLVSEMQKAISETPLTTYLGQVTRDCCPKNKYLYHTTNSYNKLASILKERKVKTGEFSTHPISGIGDLVIAFKKQKLFEKGVRPVWWWTEKVPENFVSPRDQFSQPEECAWVSKPVDLFPPPQNFDLEDVEAIIIMGMLGKDLLRQGSLGESLKSWESIFQ